MRFRSALLTSALVLGTVAVANAGGPIGPAYAPINSPALTGVPTAPTAATADNSTTVATTALSAAKVAVETNRATLAETAIGQRIPSASTAGTPTLLCGGAAPTAVTYTKQTLSYVPIGPIVEFAVDLEWSALTCTGAVTIAGLPSGATLSPEMAVFGNGVTVASSPYATVTSAGPLAFMLASSTTAPGSDSALAGTALGASGALLVSSRYFTN